MKSFILLSLALISFSTIANNRIPANSTSLFGGVCVDKETGKEIGVRHYITGDEEFAYVVSTDNSHLIKNSILSSSAGNLIKKNTESTIIAKQGSIFSRNGKGKLIINKLNNSASYTFERNGNETKLDLIDCQFEFSNN